jgi:hypothetical protein
MDVGFLGVQLISILLGLLALLFPVAILVLLVLIYKKTRLIEELLKRDK